MAALKCIGSSSDTLHLQFDLGVTFHARNYCWGKSSKLLWVRVDHNPGTQGDKGVLQSLYVLKTVKAKAMAKLVNHSLPSNPFFIYATATEVSFVDKVLLWWLERHL